MDEADARLAAEAAFSQCVKRSGLPRRYRHPHWHEGAQAALEAFNSGAWCLYLHGDVGRGKTDYAASVLVAAAARRPSGRYLFRGEADLLAEVRDAQGERGDRAAAGRLAACRLLVVDDLGKARLTPWGLEVLWRVLDRRYSDGLPTVLTSQMGRRELAERLCAVDEQVAKPLASRLMEGTVDVALDGPDRRVCGG